jgi:hypothetical protein
VKLSQMILAEREAPAKFTAVDDFTRYASPRLIDDMITINPVSTQNYV